MYGHVLEVRHDFVYMYMIQQYHYRNLHVHVHVLTRIHGIYPKVWSYLGKKKTAVTLANTHI